MNQREIEAWVTAGPGAVERATAVRSAVLLAHADWLHRMQDQYEVRDLAPWCPAGCVLFAPAARTASIAAAELAVVCAVWPRPIDAALRRVIPGLRG
jgi:hypothetical protein